jgi:alkylhydroperoxidase domain protein
MTDKVLSTPPHVEPVVFTRDMLDWLPWLEPMAEQDLTARHMAGLVDAARAKSAYFRLLVRDPEVLEHRTKTDKDIFYNPEAGLPRAERELAAAATSRFNGCIYCASVHARLSAQLSKREADVDRLLDKGVGSVPDLGLDERWQAVVTLAVELARTPMAATTEHVARLRDLGLSDLEILDISQAAAFFSWANRLMLTLGEPYYA